MYFYFRAVFLQVYSVDVGMILGHAGKGAKCQLKQPIQHTYCFCSVMHRKQGYQSFRATRKVQGKHDKGACAYKEEENLLRLLFMYCQESQRRVCFLFAP